MRYLCERCCASLRRTMLICGAREQRRLKHSCVIQRKGDPCVACAVKGKPCLFALPPTTRVRKVKEDESASGSSTVRARFAFGAGCCWNS